MVRYDFSDACIRMLDLPNARQRETSHPCKFQKGLKLIIRWRHKQRVTIDISKHEPQKYYTFIWRLRYTKPDGKRSTIDLGFWPAMNQDAAVAESKNKLEMVKQGRDPSEEKQKQVEYTVPQSSSTEDRMVKALCNAFLIWRFEKYSDKISTNEFYKSKIDCHIMARWGLFDYMAVTPWMWGEHLSEIRRKDTDSLAKQVHATWRAMFTFGVNSDQFPEIKSNPFLQHKIVKELKVKPRKRFLSNEELHSWMNEIHTRGTETQNRILMLQLYEGVRIQEILNIKLSDLKSLSKSEIPIIVKGGRESSMMVSTQAIELIKAQLKFLLDTELKSAYLFPCHLDHERQYTTVEAGKFVESIRRKWVSFSTHDLRRTLRTWLQEFGCPLEMRNIISNHTQPQGKDKSYDHARRKDEQLRWVQLWADKLDEIKEDENAFQMEADTSIDDESAKELDGLLDQLI